MRNETGPRSTFCVWEKLRIIVQCAAGAWLLCSMSVVLVSACGDSSPSGVTVQPADTPLAKMSDSPTPAPTKAPTPTAVPSPTPTVTPSSTPTATPSPTPTFTPSQTPTTTPSPTPTNTNSLGWGHKVWRKVARGMFYPVPGRQRPYTTRIRTQFTQIRLNRRHLLLDAPIHLPFNPSTHLLEHPLDRVQLRTVSRLDDRRKAYIPHLLATVSTRPIPYQRFHVRVMLQLLDRLSYIIGPHRVDPPPYQPPPPNV